MGTRTSHIVVRRARASDADRFPAVERSAGEAFRSLPNLAWIADDPPMAARVHRALIASGTAWSAEDDGDIVGFLAAEVVGSDLHIRQLAVSRDRHRQGIGRCLVAVAVDHAHRQGLSRLTLTTFREVAWNGPWYGRLGFSVVAKGEPRLDAVLDREAELGLPMAQRCAMVLTVSRNSVTE